MLGKKAAEIRILEERNQELEAALPFAELAVEIGQRAAQCMQGSNVESYFDQILQDVEAAARKRLLQQQFDELPPEERLKALASYMPDEEVQEALRAEKARQLGKDKIEKVARGLALNCKEYCRVDLAQIPAGADVKIHLNTLNDFERFPKPAKLAANTKPDRSLRLASQGDSAFQVLSDTYYNNAQHERLSASPILGAHEIIKLGSTLDESADFAYTAFYGAPLSVQPLDSKKSNREAFRLAYGKNQEKSVRLGVSQILINNMEIMGPAVLPDVVRV